MQFAAQSLLRRLTFFNTAPGEPVEDKIRLPILNFRDEERIAMPDNAQGSLSGFDFQVLPAWESFYDQVIQ